MSAPLKGNCSHGNDVATCIICHPSNTSCCKECLGSNAGIKICLNKNCECHTAHQSSHLRDFQFPDKVKPSVVAGALDEMYGQSSQSIEYGELTTEMIGKATREYLSSQSKGETDWKQPHEFAQTPLHSSTRQGECVCGLLRESPLHGVDKGESWEAEFDAQFPKGNMGAPIRGSRADLKAYISKLLSERDNRNV